MTNTTKTFAEALSELVAQYSVHSEETETGHVAKLNTGEYIEIQIHDDTNDLDEYKENFNHEDRDLMFEDVGEDETVYICSYCHQLHEDEDAECCEDEDEEEAMIVEIHGREELLHWITGK